MSIQADNLYRCVIDIDDKYIEEAQNAKLHAIKPAIKPWLSLAACLGLILVIGAVAFFNKGLLKPQASTTGDCSISISYENGTKTETLSFSQKQITGGLDIPVTLADGTTVQALNVHSADAAIETDGMTPEEAEYYAYMDYDDASEETKELILTAREQIIYSKSWAADGVEVIVKHPDGTEERLPAFSELFPGWEMPTVNTTEITSEGLGSDVQYGVFVEVLEKETDYLICRVTEQFAPFEAGQIVKVYYPENYDKSSIKEGEELLIGYYGKDFDSSGMAIHALEITDK